MTKFYDGGKHVWLATAETGSLLALKTTTKISEIVQSNREGTTRTRAGKTVTVTTKATAVTTTSHARPSNTVLSASWRLCLLRGGALRQLTFRTETPTRANGVPFAQETNRATRVRRTRPVCQGYCRGHLLWFRKTFERFSFAFHVAQHKIFMSRAHGLLRQLLTVFAAWYLRWGPALPACSLRARLEFLRRKCALTAPPPSTMVRVRQKGSALPAPSPSAGAQTRQWGHAPLTLSPSTMIKEAGT